MDCRASESFQKKSEYLRMVQKAIILLDAFGLDASHPKAQLESIDEQ